jgi:hypothetical protein
MNVKMGADCDGDQAECDICERFESGERSLPEEVESGVSDEYAAQDLSGDSRESDAAR